MTIQTERVEVKEYTDKIIKATCDWCGEEFKGRIMESEGYGEVNLIFGFGSDYDDDKWIAEICDKCFEKHLKPKMRLSRCT